MFLLICKNDIPWLPKSRSVSDRPSQCIYRTLSTKPTNVSVLVPRAARGSLSALSRGSRGASAQVTTNRWPYLNIDLQVNIGEHLICIIARHLSARKTDDSEKHYFNLNAVALLAWSTQTPSLKQYCSLAIMFSPDDSVEECKEAFYLYDRRGDKKVECSQIGEVMRALGTNPTEGEIAKIIRSLDPAGSGTKRVSFVEFFPIYQNLRDRQKKSGGECI